MKCAACHRRLQRPSARVLNTGRCSKCRGESAAQKAQGVRQFIVRVRETVLVEYAVVATNAEDAWWQVEKPTTPRARRGTERETIDWNVESVREVT